jgi:hypothetical protein
MTKKKPSRKKKPSSAPKKKTKKKLSAKKSKSRSKPSVRSKKPARAKKSAAPKPRSRGSEPTSRPSEARIHQGVGLSTGGQSGDTQGLSKKETADSESVEELVDEGQDYEAEVISGVENALDPDESEVTTKEVPEDDVPPEYRDQEP